MPKRVIDEDGFVGWEYSHEEIEQLRIEFKEKWKLTPEEFLKIYSPQSGEHPRIPGMTDMETSYEVWQAKFLVSEDSGN